MRPQATGFGCVYFAREMLATRGEGLAGRRCVVSGSGNVALHAAQKLLEMGAKVLTLSDSDGTLYRAEGFDAEQLHRITICKTRDRGRLSSLAGPGWRWLPGATPWAIPCECAFPCAIQNELHGADARTLLANGCRLVCEGANLPCTPEAVEAFLAAGICYGPGKAANAGGVATSGLEMSQNAQHLSWPLAEVDRQLDRIMTGIHATCMAVAAEHGHPGNLVVGANIAGFLRVAQAMIDQGLG